MNALGLLLIAGVNATAFYLLLLAADPGHREKGAHRSLAVAAAFGAASGVVFTPMFLIASLLGDAAPLPNGSPLRDILVTGQVEELAKLAAFLLALRATKALREPLDAATHAAAVGLGFAVAENVIYGMDYGLRVQMERLFLATPGHMTYCVLWGVYWAAARAGWFRGRLWSSGASIFFILIPSASLHGLWNWLLGQGPLVLALSVDMVAAGVAVFLVIRLRYSSPFAHRSPLVPGHVREALRASPDSVTLNLRMAEACLRARRYADAVTHLDTCLASRAGDPVLRALRAAAVVAQGRTGPGSTELEEAARELGYEGRRRLELRVLDFLNMRTPESTPRTHLATRYIISSSIRLAGASQPPRSAGP